MHGYSTCKCDDDGLRDRRSDGRCHDWRDCEPSVFRRWDIWVCDYLWMAVFDPGFRSTDIHVRAGFLLCIDNVGVPQKKARRTSIHDSVFRTQLQKRQTKDASRYSLTKIFKFQISVHHQNRFIFYVVDARIETK